MKMKTALRRLVLSILGFLLAAAALVYICDPFYLYHGPLAGRQEVLYDRDYQVPGSIRTLRYDSVLLGSSVAENFDGDFLEEHYNEEFLKIIRASGAAADLLHYLGEAHKHQELKRVFWCMDIFALTSDPVVTVTEDPDMKFLHTETILDDYTYLFNKDVIFKKIPLSFAYSMLGRNVGGAAYDWSADKTFSAAASMQAYEKPPASEVAAPRDCQADLDCLRQNLVLILGELKAHPETEYVIFFPPYSMMWWDCGYVNGVSHLYLQVVEETLPLLAEQDNVKLYFFMNEREIICNLDNYMDMIHYSPQVNQFMLDRVTRDQNRVTKDNLAATLENMHATYQYILEEGIYLYYR